LIDKLVTYTGNTCRYWGIQVNWSSTGVFDW